MIFTYTKKENDTYKTVKQVLTQEFNISYRLLLKLKKADKIFLNGSSPLYMDFPININDTVSAILDFEEDNSNIIPKKMNLNILFEDEFFLILDKPAGISVHPSIEHYEDSLSNGIKYYFDTINLHKKIRPINRLDKNTSGIVVFAKNEYIQECLIKQMSNKIFKKEYIAICNGIFNEKNGTINEPIARKENSIIERCVSPLGSQSITHYTVIKEINNMSELLISLETGRTHQIRVHLAYVGHPRIGDSLYFKESGLISRQALHAHRIEFVHPIINKKMVVESPLPKDMKNLII